MPDCSGAEDNTQNQQQLSDEGVQQEMVSADVVFGKETDVEWFFSWKAKHPLVYFGQRIAIAGYVNRIYQKQ
jgi:hypothetical protein